MWGRRDVGWICTIALLALWVPCGQGQGIVLPELRNSSTTAVWEPVTGRYRHRWLSSESERCTGRAVMRGPHTPMRVRLDQDRVLALDDPGRTYCEWTPCDLSMSEMEMRESAVPLIVQYDVRLESHLSCGGAYVKLLNVTVDDRGSRRHEAGHSGHDIEASRVADSEAGSGGNTRRAGSGEKTAGGGGGGGDRPVSHLKQIRRIASRVGGRMDSTTPFTILFGPDLCSKLGPDALPVDGNRIRFVVVTDGIAGPGRTEHYLSNAPRGLTDTDFTHNYALRIDPDGTFEIRLDDWVVRNGSLLSAEDFVPPIVPPAMIPDAADRRPAGWDDREFVPDPSARKPADWGDEEAPRTIPDPAARRPDGWREDIPRLVPDSRAPRPLDWDNDEDGSWEPPLLENPACPRGPGAGELLCGPWTPPRVRNPDYVGRWKPPMIRNPAYRGPWRPRMVPNPGFSIERAPTAADVPRIVTRNVTALGIEVWTSDAGLTFDNLYVGHSTYDASEVLAETFARKKSKEQRAVGSKRGDFAGAGIADMAFDLAMEHPNATLSVVFLIVLGGAYLLITAALSSHDEAKSRAMRTNPALKKALALYDNASLRRAFRECPEAAAAARVDDEEALARHLAAFHSRVLHGDHAGDAGKGSGDVAPSSAQRKTHPASAGGKHPTQTLQRRTKNQQPTTKFVE